MSKKANPPPPVPYKGAVALLVLALAETGLALFQWMQLLTLRAGGATMCGVNERINCETVWNSSFATEIHHRLGIPVAGLGMVWGLTAVALSALYLAWRHSRRTTRPAVNALRIIAAAGVLSTLIFALASARTGALCPTCLGTYVLVFLFAAVAWRGLPLPLLPQAGETPKAIGWSLGVGVAAYLALLAPGLATPGGPDGPGAALANAGGQPESLDSFLRGLSVEEQQQVADALDQYRRTSPKPSYAPARKLYGKADAPVKMVEWTDSRCPHCKMLVEAVAELKRRVPEGKMSLEARQYPLDAACNTSIPPQYTDGTHLRCTAAKAQICLEGADDFWALREKLFAAQATLTTPERVMEIASSGTMTRADLDACVASEATATKLREDVAYALEHDIHGTPLVVVNGRAVPSSVSFLYALAMTGGDAHAAAFSVLPPARPAQAHQH